MPQNSENESAARQQGLLLLVIEKLETLSVPYMVTGSIAASFFGVPRTTHDFDFVVEIYANLIPRILRGFGEDFYISEDAILDALRRKTMFNLIHHKSGLKVDFWILDRSNEYDELRFSRRQKHKYAGKQISFIAPEDLILMKLSWTKEFPSDRHINDIRGILAVQEILDREYMSHWAKRLSVHSSLDTLLRE